MACYLKTVANAASLSKTHTNALAELAALRCAKGSIAASESATFEMDQPDQCARTRATAQALSLTQLNGMPFEQLVTELRNQKVRIYDDGDAFKLQAPKGVLTPGLLEVIKSYSADLLYLVRLGDVHVCPERAEHRPSWRYSSTAHSFICAACRKEDAAA